MGLPSAYMVALLTVLNAKRYAEEKGKKISRFRMSRPSFGKMAKRSKLRQSFLDEYEEHLGSLGWTMFGLPDGGYAFVETDSVDGWTKIASNRVNREIVQAVKGDISEEHVESLLEISDISDINENED